MQRIEARLRDAFLWATTIDAGVNWKRKGNHMVPPEADLRVFRGSSALRGCMCLCPELMAYVAEKKHIEYCKLKEEQKLNEEVASLAKAASPSGS